MTFLGLFKTRQVNDCMSLNKKPLTPWIIAESTGKIITGHYDCMAGLDSPVLMWLLLCGLLKLE